MIYIYSAEGVLFTVWGLGLAAFATVVQNAFSAEKSVFSSMFLEIEFRV